MNGVMGMICVHTCPNCKAPLEQKGIRTCPNCGLPLSWARWRKEGLYAIGLGILLALIGKTNHIDHGPWMICAIIIFLVGALGYMLWDVAIWRYSKNDRGAHPHAKNEVDAAPMSATLQLAAEPTDQEIRYCKHCGHQIASDSVFCEKCGKGLT